MATCGQWLLRWAADLQVLKWDITGEAENTGAWVSRPRVTVTLGAASGLGSLKSPGGAKGDKVGALPCMVLQPELQLRHREQVH